MQPFRQSLVAVSLCLLFAPLCHAAERLVVQGQTMGTYFRVTIDSPAEQETAAGVRAEVDARLAEINAQMSTWDESSEISRFNRSESTDWFPVSAEFAAVVQEAARIHGLTDGAFDPTVSPLVDLWGFGSPGRQQVPAAETVQQTLQRVGMSHVQVRQEPPALKKERADVQLNLSAIAKGYAVDAVAELLAASGRPSFIVDIGGETRAGVAKASGDAWKIGVESPEAGVAQSRPPTRIVPVTELSIATSGDYRNFFEADGVTYSHTINPATGFPLKAPPASVSVIHASCMTADALATAMMVLGAERGLELAEQQELSVLFQVMDESRTVQQSGTGLFGTDETATAEAAAAPEQSPWIVFVAAGVLFLLAVGGMAIGVILSNREIKGSCGGLASMPGNDGKSICELCTVPRNECVNEQIKQQLQAAGEDCDGPEECSGRARPETQETPS